MRETVSSGIRSAPIEIAVGSALGSYVLDALLGEGAMGRVYRASHALLGREVAIKVLNPEYVARPDVVQRFFREARVVNDIDHEHIVEVTDFVETPGLAYLVMELLEGQSLRELMKQRGRKYPPLKRAVELMAQVCDALQAAHDKGVVHRDLKPDNVFVVKRRGEDFVKVLDFGVAKLRDSLDAKATSSGVILGTPLYMAPEQAMALDVDARADVWAAGVVLYELLAGAVPFTGANFVELATRIRQEAPKPLPAKTPRGERIPPALAAVALRCLEKRPADRFRSMEALAEALRAPRKRTAARPPMRVVAIAAAAVLAVGGAAIAVRLGVPGRIAAAVGSAAGWVKGLFQEGEQLARNASPSLDPSPNTNTIPTTNPNTTATPAPTATPSTTRTPNPTTKSNTASASASKTRHAPTSTTRTASKARATAAAPRPPTVELVLRSSPAGASVVRLDTGERLGKTPIHARVAKKAATVWLRMALDGYQPVKFTVDLRRDNTANVTFRGVKKKASRRR